MSIGNDHTYCLKKIKLDNSEQTCLPSLPKYTDKQQYDELQKILYSGPSLFDHQFDKCIMQVIMDFQLHDLEFGKDNLLYIILLSKIQTLLSSEKYCLLNLSEIETRIDVLKNIFRNFSNQHNIEIVPLLKGFFSISAPSPQMTIFVATIKSLVHLQSDLLFQLVSSLFIFISADREDFADISNMVLFYQTLSKCILPHIL